VRLFWRPQAETDRKKAIEYIAERNVGAALAQLDEIERRTDMLIEHPELGRPGRIRGTRELVISRTPFIAIYRVRRKIRQIEIIRLLHGAQKWPPRG
jgi:toxin ParE1/3/4